jgi:Vitamin B12 dependent methionine synthase, activation domain.
MEDIRILKHIRPSYDKNLILSRLGYKRGVTDLGDDFKQLLDNTVKLAEELCALILAYRTVDIEVKPDGTVRLEDGTVLSGKAMASMLSGADRAVLMASTAGPRVMEEIRKLMEDGRPSEAVILDAAASEITDAGLDFLMNYINTFLRRQGKMLTKHRFSPGYGDFGLEQQVHFARLLDAERLGICLTETCMLIPEKSVFAIAGITEIKSD